jgi:uncharacterized membrane protein YjfL (UPF0719 family)
VSDDETLVFIVSIIVSVIVWGKWICANLTVTSLGLRFGARLPLHVVPIVCAALLLAVLNLFASHDVRDSPTYIGFYLVLGAAWVGLAACFLSHWGLSVRDDALERRNPAATIGTCGALIGLTLSFAGANIGDGPGWWVVVFSGGLSTSALLFTWLAVEQTSRMSESITVDRDAASGWRLAGLLVSTGLVFGRAVAGNWKSAHETVVDFLQVGWFAVVLAFLVVLANGLFRPKPERPNGPVVAGGLMPAVLCVAIAAVYVYSLGKW